MGGLIPIYLIGALALASCSEPTTSLQSPDSPVSTITPTSPPDSESELVAVTVVEVPWPELGEAARCLDETPARPLPDEVLVGQILRVDDFNGDGAEETIRIYMDPGLYRWFIRVELANGYADEVRITQTAYWDFVKDVRVITFGSDRLVLARVTGEIEEDDGSILPDRYGFFSYRDCRVRPVSTPEGERLDLAVGVFRYPSGFPYTSYGIACTGDEVIATTAQNRKLHFDEEGRERTVTGPETIESDRYVWDSEARELVLWQTIVHPKVDPEALHEDSSLNQTLMFSHVGVDC